jgi:ADP-dependent NAD(P)H-hydrate dehydratase / NAD(P)H-hydrate epimerase
MSAQDSEQMEPTFHRARLYSAAQVRALDRCAIEQAGIPGPVLMRRAARAAYDAMRARWPRSRRLAVLCGPGNNGGDGYEIARLARIDGLEVRVAAVGAVPGSGDAVGAHAAFLAAGGEVSAFDAAFGAQMRETADVIVDAIFGIGITRGVTGLAAQALQAINARAAHQRVLAVDLPSGLDADDGRIHGIAVRADLSVSFIGRKLGVYVGAGPDHAGERVFDDLGVPPARIDAAAGLASLQDEADLALLLPPRLRAAHKGQHGHVLVVGGDAGMCGAALLAARGALRAGAGKLSVATRAAHAMALTAAQPEAMVHGVENAGALDELARRADVIALGPGLGTALWGKTLFDRALRAGKPLVLDADALNLLAHAPHLRLPPDSILTPHPGEAARLLGTDTAQVQRDRIGAARALRERHHAVIVLKGAGSIVCGDALAICPYGNPGMAVGGMGDVLTGIIAALRGQGFGAERAADLGVLVHALAGDAAASQGERGLLPSDVVDAVRAGVNP